MKTVDFSGMIVLYNLVIGILIMLSSEKLASLAGLLNKSGTAKIARLTKVSSFTFGASVAALSAGIYISFHIFRIGV
jgi:hypothetical protein